MPTTFTHLLEPELQRLIDEQACRELRDALSVMEPADIADMIETLDPESGVVAFHVLPRDLSGETFADDFSYSLGFTYTYPMSNASELALAVSWAERVPGPRCFQGRRAQVPVFAHRP